MKHTHLFPFLCSSLLVFSLIMFTTGSVQGDLIWWYELEEGDGTVIGYNNGNPDGNGSFAFDSKRDDQLLVGGSVDKTFNGAMDDIRFYDSMLTENEIKALAIPEPVVLVPALFLMIAFMLKRP